MDTYYILKEINGWPRRTKQIFLIYNHLTQVFNKYQNSLKEVLKIKTRLQITMPIHKDPNTLDRLISAVNFK